MEVMVVDECYKVSYDTLDGGSSKAYVDIIRNYEGDEWCVAVGTNKHTDEPVALMWDERIERWVEVGLKR